MPDEPVQELTPEQKVIVLEMLTGTDDDEYTSNIGVCLAFGVMEGKKMLDKFYGGGRGRADLEQIRKVSPGLADYLDFIANAAANAAIFLEQLPTLVNTDVPEEDS